MKLLNRGTWLVRAVVIVVLSLGAFMVSDATGLPLTFGGAVAYAQSGVDASLLAEGEKKQVIQFNPSAALQKRVFTDGFVPNSGEFGLEVAGTSYAAQRAESLRTGQVRVYYVVVGDWGNVRFVDRGTEGAGTLNAALLGEGEKKQVIQFNPDAALQKRIFADGFVPNSPEFGINVGGANYAAQRAENLGNGQVRVYNVVVGDWGNVRTAMRGVESQPPAASAPPPPPASGNSTSVTEGEYRVDILRALPMPSADLANPLEKRVNEATVQLVVLTRTDFGVATGTVVGGDGHTILTAFHVVGDPATGKTYDPLIIGVGPYLNYTLRATVVATDPDNDLAVIRITRRSDFGGFTFLPLANSDAVQLSDDTHVFSYPARREGGLGRSSGRLIAISTNVKENARRAFFTEAVASPGSSGGVVVNANGEVMGIISGGVRLPRGIDRPGLPTITQLTAFIPINLAKPLLRQAGVQ